MGALLLERLLFKHQPVGQGLHPDPLAPGTEPPVATRSRAFRLVLGTPEFDSFRDALRLTADGDVRAGVLDDLSTYFHLDADECVRRCIGWEQLSVAEWFEQRRDT